MFDRNLIPKEENHCERPKHFNKCSNNVQWIDAMIYDTRLLKGFSSRIRLMK